MLMVAVPNIFTRNQLENRFRPDIERLLSGYFGRNIQLAVIVDESLKPNEEALAEESNLRRGLGQAPPGTVLRFRRQPRDQPREDYRDDTTRRPDFRPKASQRRGVRRQTRPSRRRRRARPQAPRPQVSEVEAGYRNRDVYPELEGFRSRRESDSRLNPKYTFETFVIGGSNRFAHAAAIAVAENPGKSYNPLTIYGDSGLGKTHLLHALGHYVRNYFDRVRVRYVSTEELTNDFINAISQNKGADFRRGIATSMYC